MDDKRNDIQSAFTGFGAEWRPSNLSPSEAQAATSWVEAKIDRRSMLTNKDRVADVRDAMWQLEKEGEFSVHRLDERHSRWRRGRSTVGKSAFRPIIYGTTNPAVSAATFPAIQAA